MSSHGGSGGGGGVTPATTVTGPDSFGDSAVVGTGTEFARQDHDHGLPSAPSDLPLAGGTMSGAIAMGSHKITGLTDGSDPQDAACFGQITGGGGGLLASVQYAPATITTYIQATDALVALDATNLTISFTAPASGDVLVRLTGLCTTGAGATYQFWGLLDHTSSAQVGVSAVAVYADIVGAARTVSLAIKITGLTPSTVYQYDWAGGCNAGNGAVYAVGKTGDPGAGGPAVMEVWSA